MVRTQKFDLDTDTTLGGNNASDYIAPSQKAIKDYVDNHSGGDTEVFVATYNTTSHSDLLAAYNAGKTIVLRIPRNNSSEYWYTTEYMYSSNEFWFYPIIGTQKYVYVCMSAYWDSWEYGNDIYDVQINGTSIVSNGEANMLTNSAYSSSNKIATMSDLPAEQVNSDWNANSGKAQILNKPSLSTVATSGSYNDLSNKPNIPTESTVSGWGFTKNTGTVTSVNNVQPDSSGNVTISVSGGANTDLSNLTSTGNNLVNTALNTRDNSTRLKFWTGTKAQYDAISTKDSNTLYNITDDQDVTLTLLQTIYPVGSVYLSTNATCPLASLFGTWTLVSSGKALWTGTGSNGGSTISAGLPNITGRINANSTAGDQFLADAVASATGAMTISSKGGKAGITGSSSADWGYSWFGIDASQSNSIYGNSSTVQPPAYVVNVWRRTA